MDADDRGPLRDLVVLDLTIARAGPTAVRYLADWGARVLRIERRSRSDSGQLLAGSREQRLPQPAPLEGAHRARPRGRGRPPRAVPPRRARRRDRREQPGAGEGEARHRLRGRWRRSTRASSTAASPGTARTVRPAPRAPSTRSSRAPAASMSITGPPGAGPARVGIAVSDSAAGHQLALGIMIALHDRERTGRGQWVKVSLLEAMISFLDFQAVRYTIDGHVPASEGNHHPTLRPMGTYRAADGHLNIAAPGEKFWRRLCAVLDDEALARRRALRDAAAALRQPPRAQRRARRAARAGGPATSGSPGSTPPASRAGPSTPSTRCSPTRRCSTSGCWPRSTTPHAAGSTCCAPRSRCRGARPSCPRRHQCPAPTRVRCSTRSGSREAD